MSERVIELFRSMGAEKLEEEIQRTAAQAGVGPMLPDDVQHIIQVVTSQPLVVASLIDLVRATEPLDGQIPHVLTLLASAAPDAEVMTRVLAVPAHVRTLGDKCLFETGVARRRGPKGLDLEDLGRRSYERASRILAILGEDRRLRRFYDDNAMARMTLDEEVTFLERCSEMFSMHARVLTQLVHVEASRSALVASTSSLPARRRIEEPRSATVPRVTETALARTLPAPAPGEEEDETPNRIANLHLVSRTEEEAAEERFRDLVAAEKTVLFSMLDPELLRAELKKVVIHQEPAIDQLCDEICLYATGTQDPRKPASYFLMGPTGVGKNYLVESLLKLFERLWGIEVPYLELEGPEFTYPSDINELKGAARGFIRSDEEGIMTQFWKRAHDKPFSVILVDEVEKSHPQLRRFFLPIMDRGVMTDNRGKVLHFNNTTIFFTSNIGYSDAQQSTSPIGFGDPGQKQRQVANIIDSKMKKTLSPEFVNRVHVVHFQALTRAAIDDIFDLEMEKIRRRYAQVQEIELRVTPGARQELLLRGFHADYGARNLAKVLNRWVNIEVSKILKRDETRHENDGVPALALLREMREGKRPFDKTQVDEIVRDCSKARIPYGVVTIDVKDGEFVFHRG